MRSDKAGRESLAQEANGDAAALPMLKSSSAMRLGCAGGGCESCWNIPVSYLQRLINGNRDRKPSHINTTPGLKLSAEGWLNGVAFNDSGETLPKKDSGRKTRLPGFGLEPENAWGLNLSSRRRLSN